MLQQVDAYNTQRIKMQADIADNSMIVKTMLIHAEDSRLLHDTSDGMIQSYTSLYDLNHELIAEYNKRYNNHQELLKCLKEVNNMIQKASRIRVGDAKTYVVSACRAAVKANNTQQLIKVIKSGKTN
jgi:Bardet-Biedl syndrome 2 protein